MLMASLVVDELLSVSPSAPDARPSPSDSKQPSP